MDSKVNRDPEFTRRQLKIAAKREFNSVGYFATDTNKIAKLAGFAAGSFYRHFKDKIAIFIEVFQDWIEEQLIEVERALAEGGSTEMMAERLTSIVITFYGNWRPLRAAARVLRISEPRVAEFRSHLRTSLVQKITALRDAKKLPIVSETEVIVFLILVERLGDAVSDGEFELPHLPKDTGKNVLYEFILRFLRGQ